MGKNPKREPWPSAGCEISPKKRHFWSLLSNSGGGEASFAWEPRRNAQRAGRRVRVCVRPSVCARLCRAHAPVAGLMAVCLCLSVHVSVCLSVRVPVSICPSTYPCPFIHVPICLSVHISICPSMYLYPSVCPPIPGAIYRVAGIPLSVPVPLSVCPCTSVCLYVRVPIPICLSTTLSVCPCSYIRLSVNVPIYPSPHS